jgi:hypothetical protein
MSGGEKKHDLIDEHEMPDGFCAEPLYRRTLRGKKIMGLIAEGTCMHIGRNDSHSKPVLSVRSITPPMYQLAAKEINLRVKLRGFAHRF